MRKVHFVLAAACILALALAGGALAQQGMGPGKGAGQMYKPQMEETITGQVTSMETVTTGPYQGVHLKVKTDKETLPVHLGPKSYLDKQEMKFSEGDKVQVTGSRVTMDGKPAIIAKEVKKDGKTMELRDDRGVPKWAGQGQRRQQQ
ncbi:MAG: DNA-binding protein [Deltaproteobacteria bacterium]|nr:DNA-binding protein [Deltaproteobacteria bacterium]